MGAAVDPRVVGRASGGAADGSCCGAGVNRVVDRAAAAGVEGVGLKAGTPSSSFLVQPGSGVACVAAIAGLAALAVAVAAGSGLGRAVVPSADAFAVAVSVVVGAVVGAAKRTAQVVPEIASGGGVSACVSVGTNGATASVHAKADDDVTAASAVLDAAGKVITAVVATLAAAKAEMAGLPVSATVCGRLLAAVVVSVPAGKVWTLGSRLGLNPFVQPAIGGS